MFHISDIFARPGPPEDRPEVPLPPPGASGAEFRRDVGPGLGNRLAWSVALVLLGGREWTRSEGDARGLTDATQEMDWAEARIAQIYAATRSAERAA